MNRHDLSIVGGVLLAVVGACCPPTARAGDGNGWLCGGTGGGPAPDKSAYTLFQPVPTDQLRDFNPDRPTRFTSPQTIDAGHVQLELDLANYTRDRNNPERARVDIDQWNVAPPDIRVGLTEHTELDLIWDGYLNLRTHDRDAQTRRLQSGFGDLTLLFKYNLFGNDKGDVSFAVEPNLKIPTSTAHLGNGRVEGGLLFPLSINLPANFSLGLSTEFDALRNDDNDRYVAGFTNIAFLGYNFLDKKFQVYGEFYSQVTAGRGAQLDGEVDTGLIYFIGKNMEVDFGCNFGVTRAAPDYEPFVGLSRRF